MMDLNLDPNVAVLGMEQSKFQGLNSWNVPGISTLLSWISARCSTGIGFSAEEFKLVPVLHYLSIYEVFITILFLLIYQQILI